MEVSHEPSEHPPQTQWRRLFWATVLALCVYYAPLPAVRNADRLAKWEDDPSNELTRYEHGNMNQWTMWTAATSCCVCEAVTADQSWERPRFTTQCWWICIHWVTAKWKAVNRPACYNNLQHISFWYGASFSALRADGMWMEPSERKLWPVRQRQRTEPCSTSPHPQGRPTPPATQSQMQSGKLKHAKALKPVTSPAAKGTSKRWAGCIEMYRGISRLTNKIPTSTSEPCCQFCGKVPVLTGRPFES